MTSLTLKYEDWLMFINCTINYQTTLNSLIIYLEYPLIFWSTKVVKILTEKEILESVEIPSIEYYEEICPFTKIQIIAFCISTILVSVILYVLFVCIIRI